MLTAMSANDHVVPVGSGADAVDAMTAVALDGADVLLCPERELFELRLTSDVLLPPRQLEVLRLNTRVFPGEFRNAALRELLSIELVANADSERIQSREAVELAEYQLVRVVDVAEVDLPRAIEPTGSARPAACGTVLVRRDAQILPDLLVRRMSAVDLGEHVRTPGLALLLWDALFLLRHRVVAEFRHERTVANPACHELVHADARANGSHRKAAALRDSRKGAHALGIEPPGAPVRVQHEPLRPFPENGGAAVPCVEKLTAYIRNVWRERISNPQQLISHLSRTFNERWILEVLAELRMFEHGAKCLVEVLEPLQQLIRVVEHSHLGVQAEADTPGNSAHPAHGCVCHTYALGLLHPEFKRPVPLEREEATGIHTETLELPALLLELLDLSEELNGVNPHTARKHATCAGGGTAR